MTTFNDARVRAVNDRPPDPARDYVLYWVQAYRRLGRNHALGYALQCSRAWGKPLVVYEGLRLDYPWASARHHRFILEGVLANARRAARMGINYWPFVETPGNPGRGLLRKLTGRACLVVTDDFPAFIVPGQTAALAARADVAVAAVDGNGLVPLRLLGQPVSAANHLRGRLHKLFAEAWRHRAAAEPVFPKPVRTPVDPPFETWPLARGDADAEALGPFVASLPIDQSVARVGGREGGTVAGRRVVRAFVRDKLARFAEGRNQPDDLAGGAASGLSPYLHYGHVSVQEVAEAVLESAGGWTPARLDASCRGRREGFFHPDPNVNAFLDEAITWRDVGYHWASGRAAATSAPGNRNGAGDLGYQLDVWGAAGLEAVLPAWAAKTLAAHARDPREHVYGLEEFEAGATHDVLWNAAQRELAATGRLHNYLRMLWGKKVLEWSASPAEAYRVLEHLNNKYALDGRDPNSYSGILWCFGLFDRPWAPERQVLGTVRYMSSENTARKFDLSGYYRYVESLGNFTPPAPDERGRPSAGLSD